MLIVFLPRTTGQLLKNIVDTAVYNFVPFVNVEQNRNLQNPWFYHRLKHLHGIEQRRWKNISIQKILLPTQNTANMLLHSFNQSLLSQNVIMKNGCLPNRTPQWKFYAYVKSQTRVKQTIPCAPVRGVICWYRLWKSLCFFLNTFHLCLSPTKHFAWFQSEL